MSVREYYQQIEGRGDQPIHERVKELLDVTERFAGLLKEQQNGLMSWWMMVGEVGRELSAHLLFAGIMEPRK